MEIIDYVKPTAKSIYADDVQTLIEAGEGKAGGIKVPNDAPKLDKDKNPVLKDGKPVNDNSIANAKRAFQNAAREASKTARVVNEIKNDDNTTTIVFVLTNLIERKDGDGAETATDAEYPAADVAPDEAQSEPDAKPDAEPVTNGRRAR